MKASETILSREQTRGEEIANSVSHGVGFLAAIACTPVLIVKSLPGGGPSIIGASIFGASMIILYFSSALYHALPANRAKKLFRIFDHAAIFLLIAGTYTPFTLGLLRGGWGWSLFGIVWGLALFGILLKSIGGPSSGQLSTALYLLMGWVAIVAVKPLWLSMPLSGLLWLLAGGLMYSAGVYFFARDHKQRYNHFIWHLFVLAGTACHVVAVMKYAF